MYPLSHRGAWLGLWLMGTAALVSGCSQKRVVVGFQCPSPYSGFGSFAPDSGIKTTLGFSDVGKYVGDAGRAGFFGTSCAPCKSAPLKLDKHGCPIYVTFESCGGDICLGDQLIRRPVPGGAGEDAGNEADAGSAQGGSSAR